MHGVDAAAWGAGLRHSRSVPMSMGNAPRQMALDGHARGLIGLANLLSDASRLATLFVELPCEVKPDTSQVSTTFT